ncbi:NAD(P)/FAD-dependent oxidoreductase [Mucilaginibacter sp. UR6-11]|uniref:FAD-dependent oxidoreductase n=1 Tax=Mucilaginibacter sp. UR6-11 TaxID=1435644 RepID=UPI001E33CC81|nr:NAD(P)/FAD-dependent oxidoreductase [Mucilaginibacter sp. UR6-11]MCC8424817.1 FAD-dependent monooxygenase [Mucilaginibacter sp. UR6-11]
MTNLQDKKIAIIGGGPGGLTLARLLQMNGADVNVYERDHDSSARAKGATLDLHDESGLRALREAGLMDAFMANYRPGADRMHLMDMNANSILEEDVNGEGEYARPEIDRGPLQEILLASLKPGTVIWDSHFTAMTQKHGVWKLEFKNGTEAFADLAIAADGANSRVRPYITPIKPFYSGVTAIEGAVYHSEINSPKIHRLLNGGKIFAFGDSKSLIVSAKGNGSLVFYPSFKTDEHWVKTCGLDFNDKAQLLAWFKAEYQGWDEVWLELFENATGIFIPRPLYCMPLDQTWEAQPNLTMLGDAAHLMPPFAGEGVNMAMLDAVELSRCLRDDSFADIHAAITAYEQQMRLRASATAAGTMVSTEALHSPNAIEFMMSLGG